MTEEAGLPRPEYPRPALRRGPWLDLNGPWELAFDPDDRGLREGWEAGRTFPGRVTVPYPLESTLSGVGERGPHPIVWYRRLVELPEELREAPRLVLRVGACDHAARAFVNGRGVGAHRGGYAPFAFDVGHAVRAGENEIVLRVEDRATWAQARGKQIAGPATPVDYTPVTGLWQTVWLEPLPAVSVGTVWTRFSLARGELAVHVELDAAADAALFGGEVEAVLYAPGDADAAALAADAPLPRGALVARGRTPVLGRVECRLVLPVPGAALWSPAEPRLHTLVVRLVEDDRVVDETTSEVGLRELRVEGERLLLNDAPLFLRGALDQGYFPGGWYAAARDEDYRRDILLAKEMGLDCVRKHQKAEDPRFLHHADRLGLLVWCELPSGRDFTTRLVVDATREWAALVRRDRGHACVMAWVPFNESWGVWQQASRPEQRAWVEALCALTRALDLTRPVLGNDGWEWSGGDLWGLHSYATTGRALAAHVSALRADPWSAVLPEGELLGPKHGALPGADPRGRPLVLTECGGVGYRAPGSPEPERALFVYGELPRTPEAFEARLRDLAAGLAAIPGLAGFVWTQLTDVEQECNGLLDFERRPKLPLATLRGIFGAIGDGRR